MYKAEDIVKLVEQRIEGTGVFLISAEVKPGNQIVVTLDKNPNLGIDECIEISRFLEQNLDREKEDFELEVSSAGLGQPFKILQQYIKNIGKKVEVLQSDGIKHEGILLKANETELEIETKIKVKPEGKKRFEYQPTVLKFTYNQIKSTKNIIDIK